MRKAPVPVSRLTKSRAGFSLIELMIVMSIIVLLVALLLPALTSVQQSVRVAQVRTEITNLEKAIADFKSTFNIDPPSDFVLHEAKADWDTPPTVTTNASKAIIRAMWPSFDFENHDIDGDGTPGETHELKGAECLVFFLGGIPSDQDPPNKRYALLGFSKNPTNPFDIADRQNRLGPFHEFDTGRLVDRDNDGFLEYLDPIPGSESTRPPLVYASSNGGSAYVDADLVTAAGISNLATVYRQGPDSTDEPWKNKTFQIVSPGIDFKFGSGGNFDPNDSTAHGLTNTDDYDNITNFHNSVLGP